MASGQARLRTSAATEPRPLTNMDRFVLSRSRPAGMPISACGLPASGVEEKGLPALMAGRMANFEARLREQGCAVLHRPRLT